MDTSCNIGDTIAVTYVGKDYIAHKHLFKHANGNDAVIADDSLNGQSLLKENKDFFIKRNTIKEYTVVGEA